MEVSLARCQNVKMVPFDVVVTGVFNVISNGRRVVIFQKGFEMFRFLVVESSLRFSDVKIIAVPATSFIDDFGAVETVLVWEEGFDAPCVLKNNLDINKRVETIYARF